MAAAASSGSSRQLTAMQLTSYREAMSPAMARARSPAGSAEFTSTTKGFPSSCSSRITRSSASR